MDNPAIIEMRLQNVDPGDIADAIINYLDANWSLCTFEQRDELISEAAELHAVSIGTLPAADSGEI